MIWITHAAFALLAGIILRDYFTAIPAGIYYSILAFSSLLPDIDTHESKAGKKAGFISYLIEAVFGHRTIFHSIIIAVLSFMVINIFFPFNYALIFALGYTSHILLDSLTYAGVMPFYPIRWRVCGFIKTRSASEFLLLFLIAAISLYLI